VTLCGTNAGQTWAEPVLMLTLGVMLVLPGLWLVSHVFVGSGGEPVFAPRGV
jgi:hypothetical protein